MPRKITINESPNPTGLTMQERQLALNVLASMEASVTKLRDEEQASRRYNHRWRGGRDDRGDEWTAEDEQDIRQKVYRSAYSQLTGRQKTEAGRFTLHTDVAVPDNDMAYVLKSLGVTQ